MAIKLADTARPNNYVDAEHLGTYPVAYAEDVWFADGTRLSDKTFDGQSIQKEELPLASADELGNIYQYIGVSGTYEHGYFYECVSDGESTPTYSWKEVISSASAIIDTEELPSNDIKNTFYRNISSRTTITYDSTDLAQALVDLATYGFYQTNFIESYKTLGNAYVLNIPYGFKVMSDGEFKTITFMAIVTNTGYSSLDFGLYIEKENGSGGFIVSNQTFVKFNDTLYAGSETNQEFERIAKYTDIPDVSKKPNTFTGTQAEWSSLTNDEKAMYTIVNITDDDGGTNLDYYSTFETKTNKVWIDGKPIYRKVLVRTADASGTGDLTIGTISNFAQLVSITTITNSNNGVNQEIEFYRYRDSRLHISNGTATVHMDRLSNYNIDKVIMIVEYTKLAD